MGKEMIGDGYKYRRTERYCVNRWLGVEVPVAAISIAPWPRATRVIGIASWDSLERSRTAMDGIEPTLETGSPMG